MKVDFINVFPEAKYLFSEWLILTKLDLQIKNNIPIIHKRNRLMIENFIKLNA